MNPFISRRILNDKEFVRSMTKIEKEVAKIFGVTLPYVTAVWDGKNKIEITIARDYELVVKE